MVEDGCYSRSDLRAAVAAGILSEAQAANLTALAQDRSGKRASLRAEDEPFEFFRGFAEIFIASGLSVFLGGIALLLSLIGGIFMLILIPSIVAAMSWWMARYFTLSRRMNLPSMVLVSAYAAGIYVTCLTVFGQLGPGIQIVAFSSAAVTALSVLLWFRRFKLPFTMFIFGIFMLLATYALFTRYNPGGSLADVEGWMRSFVPHANVTLASVVFGLGAFCGAMWFDLKDPYRLGRYSATAFWLHLLAGAALVNSITATIWGQGGASAILPTAAAIMVFAIVALIIDRRSLLTSGIVYICAVIFWAVTGDGSANGLDWAKVLIILGVLFTAIGTWWVQLRNVLLRALPDFPGKQLLPPYSEKI